MREALTTVKTSDFGIDLGMFDVVRGNSFGRFRPFGTLFWLLISNLKSF